MEQAQVISQATPAPLLATDDPPRKHRGLLIMPLLVLILTLAWLSANGKLYSPGDNIGYYMGVAGAVMMLVLLLYPLRKHVALLRNLGEIRHWFRLHMLFGIVGPLLIIFHSTFSIGSLNAGVAMVCMLLVAGSGIVGRFMYRRIHHGLYGRRATLQEMQARVGSQEGAMHSKFHFAPRVESQLIAFGLWAAAPPQGFSAGTWRFLTLGLRARWVHARCMHELRKLLHKHAERRDWPRAKLQQRLATASSVIAAYLLAVRHTAQFTAYERLFSLWHILHVPFVFMLVISGVVHVIAVHMY